MRPGHIISFDYLQKKRRKIPRIVFILNSEDMRFKSKLIHGLNLENIKWTTFLSFVKSVLVTDTLTMIKRKYELRGPFNEIIDKPLIFYKKLIKPKMLDYDAYRTYKSVDIKNPKIYALNYSRLFTSNMNERNLIINKKTKLNNLISERSALNEIFKIDTNKLKDRKYKQLILDRFGSEEVFRNTLSEITEMINLDQDEL